VENNGKTIGPLPEFGRPPVSEVAASIHFPALSNWRSVYGGVFWTQIRSDYPAAQSAIPLPYATEKFDEITFLTEPIRFQAADPDLQRFWFLSEDGTKLLQVQKDRLIVNWRKVIGNEVYPRYDYEIRPRFKKEIKRFRSFISENDLGNIEEVQCELTYVNDFIMGEDWNSFPEAIALLSHWTPRGSTNFLPPLDTLSFQGFFTFPEGNGRLHFAAQHVLRQIDNKQAVQLRLNARGNPDTSSDEDILSWMDLAREWIVRGFTDFTSSSAHRLWDRKR
jgi:uncharacterized protein (TIGR04255 family)